MEMIGQFAIMQYLLRKLYEMRFFEIKRCLPFCVLLLLMVFHGHGQSSSASGYEALIGLFQEWRAFEKPPLYEGAPDYRKETFAARTPKFDQLQQRLAR